MASCSTSFDSDTGWQTLLKELQKKATGHVNENNDEPILGVRVVYCNNSSSNPSNSDHSDLHNEHWKKALTDSLSDRPRSLEVGTVTGFDFKEGVVSVLWDCGNTRTYTYDLWKNLTVYSLGPAGYLGQMVFCDKCLDPSKSLAFRLARQNKSVGDLYDLCVQCYNEGDDEHMKSCFHCNIPSGNIDQDDDDAKKRSLPTREESVKYSLVGIFKHATVAHSDCNSATSTGEVLNIVHEKGKYDLRKADYYDSCAEVKLEDGSLVYWEAGSGGKVELKAIKPGEAPFPVAIDHYIKFGDVIVKEMFTYKTKLVKMVEPVLSYCFMRFSPPDDGMSCYSLTISGTRLTEITDTEIWRRCKDLKIVILLMNELNSLPADLQDHASTVELVCVQHNKFTIVPPIIYEVLTNIKHLNLHGNQISIFPSELQYLQHLERLKFGRNYLYSLPDMFSGFKCLIEITFNNNFLTRLPPSFAELTRLESIDLTNNSFTCIPAPLLKLPNLKSIYMRFNRIHRLSPLEDIGGTDTLALLQNMVTLSLEGNPIYIRLKPSTDTTLENVRANFVTLEQFPGPITKALRVLVLGSCGSGKTSIVEAISFDKYVTPTTEMHHDHTVGIDRFSIPVKMTTKGEQDFIVELRLWDFAGERSYVMMNNLFVTDDTLIWIAVNFQTYKCTPGSFQQYVAPWIEQVMTRTAKPIVWIIGTHTDKCTAQEIKNKEMHIRYRINRECDVFKKTICKELDNLEKSDRSPLCIQKKTHDLEDLKKSNVPCFVKDNLKVVCLTNTYGFKGLNSLKTELVHIIDSFKWLCTPLSTHQQKTADNLRQKTEEFLSRGEAPIISKTTLLREVLDSQDEEAEETDKFLKYLYHIGAVLICKSHSDTTVILDVDWLINLLKQIFHHDFPAMIESKIKSNTFHGLFTSGNIKEYVQHQQSTGMVVDDLLDALWGLKETTKKQLIEFLETMGLAYTTKESPDLSGCLFPWLVVRKFPGPIPPKVSDQDRHILISYDFSPCIPTCFVQQLVVRCQRSRSLSVHIESVYEDAFIIYTNNSVTNKPVLFSVHVLEQREPESMCGKVYVLITQDSATETINTASLWCVAFKIIGIMQTMLSFWTFYSNLKRNIHCTLCNTHCWRLQLKTDPNTLSPSEHPFICKICKKSVSAILITPPQDLMLKEDEYFDNRESQSPPIDHYQTSDESRSNSMSVPETQLDSISPFVNESVQIVSLARPSMSVPETQLDSISPYVNESVQIVSLARPSMSSHYPQQQTQDDTSPFPSPPFDPPPPYQEAVNPTATGAQETTDQLEMGSDTENTQQNLHVPVDGTELVFRSVHVLRQFFEDRNYS